VINMSQKSKSKWLALLLALVALLAIVYFLIRVTRIAEYTD